jgi:hypothetical protein
VWAVSRITANSASDRAETEALARRQCIVPLREPGEPGPSTDLGRMRLLEPPASASVQQVLDMTPQTFIHRLNLLVERAEKGSQDARGQAIRIRLSALNDLGKPLEADSELGRTLARGFADGAAAIRSGAELASQPGASGWRTFGAAPNVGGPLGRAVRAYLDLGGSAPEDVLSLICDEDEAGREFSGAERYRIHFARGATPPVEAFWSLFVAPRGARGGPGGPRRGISDRNDLSANPDGSLDLIIQHDIPGGAQLMNWLPAPAGAFTLNMRLHWPKPPAISGAWRMPAVERLGSGFARRSEQRQPGPDTPGPAPPPSDDLRPTGSRDHPASRSQFFGR